MPQLEHNSGQVQPIPLRCPMVWLMYWLWSRKTSGCEYHRRWSMEMMSTGFAELYDDLAIVDVPAAGAGLYAYNLATVPTRGCSRWKISAAEMPGSK